MISKKMEFFLITGIAIRTSNEKGASGEAIPTLWNKFLSENIIEQIPGKTSNDIYCVYTEYEKDYTMHYTVVLGCRVEKDAPIPNGFQQITIQAGNYTVFTAKGNLQEGVVFREWTTIWDAALKRIYTTDFERYGAKAQNPANAEVDIFVSIE